MAPRIKEKFKKEIVPELMEQFKYKNVMEVPKLEKIVVNMGLGKLSDAGKEKKVFTDATEELSTITGQRPITINAKNSIAGFKLREGSPVGCKVTLRGTMMYEFCDRLLNLALPRVRDFRGVSPRAFDQDGNYTLGIREQIIFPEIDYNKVDKVKGMNITFVTTAKTQEESFELLRRLGMPFRKH